MKFYERKEIKDLLAYLKVIFNPADDISTKRLLGTLEGVGKTTIERIANESGRAKKSLFGVLAQLPSFQIPEKARRRIEEFLKKMQIFCLQAGFLNAADLLDEIVKTTHYVKLLEEEETEEALMRVENIQEFQSVAREFVKTAEDPTLSGFLNHVALITDLDKLDETKPFVTMMTLHNAKGLEFPVVFMVGMEEGVFPHSRSLFEPAGLEEERRLCYVGMTRAKEFLCLITAAERSLYGESWNSNTSRFVEEVAPDFLQVEESEALVQKLAEELEESID